MRGKNRKPIASCLKLPQFTTMNVIDGQAGIIIYFSLIFYSLTINNILNIIVILILAGVSLNLAVGNEGIIQKTIEASDAYNEAQIKETIDSAYQQTVIGQFLENDDEKIRASIEDDLKKHYEGAEVTTVSGDYNVNLGDKGIYTVSESGTTKNS